MKTIILTILLIPILAFGQTVSTLGELFDSLKTHPVLKADSLLMEKADAGEGMAWGQLFPKINLFGKYDISTNPTGMRPLTLNEMFPMIKNQTIPQPFSDNILRGGATISMPIFVKSIFTMASKAKMMYKSAESKRYIDQLKNEAIISSANANLLYLDNLKIALEKKKESLEKTKELVNIKVNAGRAPESALLKIDNGLNQVEIMKHTIDLNRESAIQMIYSLTGVKLEKGLSMQQVGNFVDGEIKAIEPLKNKLEADRLAYRAEKEKLWPILALNGNYNFSTATAYNNNQKVDEQFGTIGITLMVPLFRMDEYKKISKSSVEYEMSKNEFERMNLELKSQSEQLKISLPLVESIVELSEKSVNDKDELLKIAKVSYDSGRMSIEDYLKYEDDLLLEKSKLYKSESQKWQILMKLAVIYGNNIEEIVR